MQSPEAEKPLPLPLPPDLSHFPADSPVKLPAEAWLSFEEIKRAKGWRNASSRFSSPVLLIPPGLPLLPSSLAPPRLHPALSRPHPGRPCFPTQPVTPLPLRNTEETRYLRGRVGWCHSHSHHPGPFNTNPLPWQRPRPSNAESDIQNRASAPRLGKPHTAGHTRPHPWASLPTQASHRHPPHTLCCTRSPSRGHPAASASRQKQPSWLLCTQPT